jgi:hypothetical protein
MHFSSNQNGLILLAGQTSVAYIRPAQRFFVSFYETTGEISPTYYSLLKDL